MAQEYREVDKGMHKGDLRVRDRSLLLRGIVSGDLHVSGSSDVEVKGIVRGGVYLHAGRMLITGMVQGDVHNFGGELHVHGIVGGCVETGRDATTASAGTRRAEPASGRKR